MAEIIIWDPVERFLKGMAIILLFMSAFLYILRGKKRHNFSEKVLMWGFAFFFMSHAFGIFFQYMREFVVSGIYSNYVFYGDLDNPNLLYKILSKLMYCSDSICFVLFILGFEMSTKRTKYILTIILVFITTFIIILPYNLSRIVHHSIYLIFKIGLMLIIMYIVTMRSRIEFKAISSYIVLGYLIFLIGDISTSQDVKSLNVFPLMMSPLLLILGTIIAISPLLINPKYFSSASISWQLNGIITFIIGSVYVIFLILYLGISHYYSIVGLVNLILFSYTFYRMIKMIKSDIGIKTEEKKAQVDFLRLFTKPQQITEEEISISKEKKICLICKGRVEGFTFICRGCEAFYCERCSRAISELENACWACNTPFETSKPSKPFQKEKEEKISFEESRDSDNEENIKQKNNLKKFNQKA